VKIELGLVVQNFNGGVVIDENGYTGVAGLFAAGEITEAYMAPTGRRK